MADEHPILNKLGALALFVAFVCFVVLLVKLVDSSQQHEDHKRATQAHQIVYEACGSEAAIRFERTFDGRNGSIKREQAELWAADCAEKP